MIPSTIELPSAAFSPRRLKPGNIGNWSGHLPFARDLVAAVRPSIFVELGTHYGESYFGFCQAIAENAIDCKAYAIDTWRGEHQSGFYDESIFEEVSRYNEANYSGFSYLVRGLFDDALPQFEDESIDILHIDGLHTLDAVSHDFYGWLPKVKPGGTILLHDTMVRHDDFGVWRLWSNLGHEGATFEFHHSSGLGVFEKPGAQDARSTFLNALFCADPILQAHIRRYYSLAAIELEWKHDLSSRSVTTADDYLLQVFVPLSQGYGEEQSRTIKLDVGEWQHASVDLPSGFSQGSLRIDVANRPCIIDIRGITLRSAADGRVLWTAAEKLADTEPGGTLARLSANEETGAVRFVSFGFDPQLYLPPPTSTVFDQPLTLEIWVRIQTSFEPLLPLINQPIQAAPIQAAPWVQQLESDLTAAHAETQAIYTQLAETQQHLKALEREREELIKDSNARQTKIYLLSESHAALKVSQEKLAQLERTHESLQEDYQKLEASFQRIISEYQGLEKTFHEVISSHSWKITSPMRSLLRLLPRASQ